MRERDFRELRREIVKGFEPKPFCSQSAARARSIIGLATLLRAVDENRFQCFLSETGGRPVRQRSGYAPLVSRVDNCRNRYPCAGSHRCPRVAFTFDDHLPLALIHRNQRS